MNNDDERLLANLDDSLHQNEETGGAVEAGDLEIMSNWVKRSLFGKVKFLYNPENDLKANGKLFWLFVTESKDSLEGLKRRKGEDAAYREMYVRMLWTEGTKSKANLVSEGLSMKRSAVYTALHNQFIGKQLCVEILTQLMIA